MPERQSMSVMQVHNLIQVALLVASNVIQLMSMLERPTGHLWLINICIFCHFILFLILMLHPILFHNIALEGYYLLHSKEELAFF